MFPHSFLVGGNHALKLATSPIPSLRFLACVCLTLQWLAACGAENPSFVQYKNDENATSAQDSNSVKRESDGASASANATSGGGANAKGAAGGAGGSATDDLLGGGAMAGGSSSFAPGSENFAGLELVSEEATIERNDQVDILWVVDSSGSMSEEQQYLGANFSSFINQLSASSNRFQMALTSTDICQDENPSAIPMNQRYCPVNAGGSPATHLRGNFVTGPHGEKILTPSSTDLLGSFLSMARVGIDGSGFEHGSKAVEMAVSKSLNGGNPAFLRPESFLAVIIVSDEEDDGIGLSQMDVYAGVNYVQQGLTSFVYTENNLISYLTSVKGAGNFSISSIVPTRSASGVLCNAPHTAPREEGTQYIKAAQKTGGIVQSICDTNWNNSLAKIGQDLGAQSSQIVLQHKPAAGSIKVSVDGLMITDWTYHEGTNTVKFSVASLPAAGAQVKVSYYRIP